MAGKNQAGKNQSGKRQDTYSGLALLGQLGFTIGIPILLGVAMGRFLDQRMDTSPLFLIGLLLLGLAAGIVAAYRQINTTIGGTASGAKTSRTKTGGKAKKS